MELGGATLGAARSISGMAAGGASAEHPLPGLQHALSDLALGAGAASGLASALAHDTDVIWRVGEGVRSSGVFCRDVCGYHPTSRDVLPCSELGHARAHAR